MDFDLTEDQAMIRDAARDFAAAEVAPGAAERDLTAEFPIEPFKKAAEYGFTGVEVEEQYGGAGLGAVELSLILTEINRACASTGVTLSVHNSLSTAAIALYGTEEQKQHFLPKMTSGEWLGAYSLSEAGSGSDAAAMACSAVEDGDDLVVNGTKLWVTSATHADITILFVRTSKEERKSRGITCLVVENSTPGFTVSKKEDKLGIRASSTCELVFENCRVPKANVLGEIGLGFRIAMGLLDGGRIGIASQAIGIAEASLEASIKYAKERHQFGVAISTFQAIQFKLADMKANIEAARLLTLRAAWLKAAGRPYTSEASQAKLVASTMANEVARQAVQIHGGAGYLVDFPVERYMRDARVTEIYEGTSEIQRLVIAKGLLQ